MPGSQTRARSRSTMARICLPGCGPRQSPDTSTPCWISSVVDMSPWRSKTSNCRPARSTQSPILRPSSGSESSQKAARMPQPQRCSPSWPTSSHGVSWKCRSQESSRSTMCATRSGNSNCATHAASWCCDRERGIVCHLGSAAVVTLNRKSMNRQMKLGGTLTLPGTSLNLYRMGYGAMQLAGPGVWGLPPNIDEAVGVLRDALAAGVNHIDTSDFYGPSVTNQLIKQVLHPYPYDLVIVTKVGYRRGSGKSWLPALSRLELIQAVEGNLRNLGLDVLDVVNLRVGGNTGPTEGSIEEPMNVLAELKSRGLIRHLGVSNVTPQQFTEAQRIAPIVCVQNFYNVANRHDDEFIDELAKLNIAYVPFFPLGGFTPLQSSVLDSVAASIQAKPMQVALAWLLQRSPNILLIPGTSSVAHLRENLAAATMELRSDAIAQLDEIVKGSSASVASRASH